MPIALSAFELKGSPGKLENLSSNTSRELRALTETHGNNPGNTRCSSDQITDGKWVGVGNNMTWDVRDKSCKYVEFNYNSARRLGQQNHVVHWRFHFEASFVRHRGPA